MVEVRRRKPVKRLLALGLLLLILLALAVLWSQRQPIAADYIDEALAARGVQASYDVKRIGFRTQRLENLIIGNPARPDLTARWVEVRLRWAWWQPKVTLITARGVRLYGRVEKGRLRLGQVDRLLPPPSGLPFRLPDQDIDIADAGIRLDTPAGRLGIAVEGRGNLADGFRGRLAAASPALAAGNCRLAAPRATWRVRIADLRPSLAGPVRAASLVCGDAFALAAPRIELETTLASGLDAWRGKAALGAAAARFGDDTMRALSGNVSFDGNSVETKGGLDIAAASAAIAELSAQRTSIEGRYALGLGSGRVALVANASGQGVRGGQSTLRPVIDALSSLGGTPVEPLGRALAAATRRALAGFDLSGALRLVSGPNGGAARVERGNLASRSGARLSIRGGDGLTYDWARGLARLNGDLTLTGGGFPATQLSLSQPRAGAPIRGVGRIAPMAAGGARLALGEIRFTAAPGGATSIATVATLDGPFSGGRVEGLTIPLNARIDAAGGMTFAPGCTTASFRSLRAGSLRLGATRLPLCPTGRALVWRSPGGPIQGGAEVRAPRLTGMLGETPLAVAADRLRFSLADPGFTGANVAIRMGRAGFVNHLDIPNLTGRFDAPGVRGAFDGASGKLASVPLLLSEGHGTWQMQGSNLSVRAALQVADEANPPRFFPLVSRDFRLDLADNRITAAGWLDDPETGTRIADARIEHMLASGEGRAVLDVPGIAFDETYQPEQLTRLTTGVIALVKGVVKGNGEIRWDRNGSWSSGVFSTDDMDMAATFGPVEGLKTRVEFTDLLGLTSAPGQVADIGLIRTGIDVFDGLLRYQLLPGLRVRVESGRWPFAGGELLLDETILDFSKPTAKQLTFRVVGLDAARFVQQMEFSNINATGTFDGVVPMIFDEQGGRIVGGRVAARTEGGTLSYIGELTDQQLGVYGKLAFDALKSLRYNKLVINLDGSLTGEFLAAIELDGIARDPALTVSPSGSGISGMVARRALGQLAKIPFEFNINIKGPFRTLLATTRSLEDPTNLIQSVLPELVRDKPPLPPVQPEESEIVQ